MDYTIWKHIHSIEGWETAMGNGDVHAAKTITEL